MAKTTAAFIMFLAPGVATSFYVVMVGYYQNKFHTPVFFMAMLLAVYGPYPVVAFALANFDDYFDRHFPIRSRIVFSQSLLLILTLIWMYKTPSMRSVVWLGILLGCAAALANASGHQLISLVDPKKLMHAEIGNQLGQALPLLVFYVASFEPTATDAEFRHVLCTIVVVCIFSILIFGAIHFTTSLDEACLGLSADLMEPSRQDPSGEGEQAQSGQGSAQQTASRPGDVGDKERPISSQEEQEEEEETAPAEGHRQTPRWVYIWMTTKMFTTALQASVMSLAAYFGDPAHTQFLACAKLAAEFLGRMVALPACQSFSTAPWHRFLAVTVAIRVVFALLFYAELEKERLSPSIFTFMWTTFAFLDRFANTLVDVSAGTNVETRDRKFVSRVTFAFGFAGLVLGLAVAAAIVIPLKGIGPEAKHIGPLASLVETHGQEASPGAAGDSILAVLLEESPRHAKRFAKAGARLAVSIRPEGHASLTSAAVDG
jgi:hypothetical protein